MWNLSGIPASSCQKENNTLKRIERRVPADSVCVVCFNYMVVSRGIIHVHVRCSTISPYYTPLCNCTRSDSANAFAHGEN